MAFISTSASVVLINTSTRPGVVFLPPTSQIPGRTFTIKDIGGNCQLSTCTLSTVGSDLFEDLTATKQLISQYAFLQLTASTNRWFIGNTNQLQFFSSFSLAASNVNTSTTQATTTFVQTVRLPSNPLYVSSTGFLYYGTTQISYPYIAETPQVLFS